MSKSNVLELATVRILEQTGCIKIRGRVLDGTDIYYCPKCGKAFDWRD